MIYTQLTNRAMQIAYEAHHGQLDKCGMPYIFHPFHLAEQMEDEYAVCVALLHDVLEDTDYPREALAAEFPAEIMEALDLLTHQEGVPYLEYVEKIKPNPLAKAVKLADLIHNTDKTRIPLDGPEVQKILAEKYRRAFEILK